VKPERIRIKIAERCGWSPINTGLQAHYHWKRDSKTWQGGVEFSEDLPDYPNDLNAMHEAESVVIEPWEIDRYAHELYQVLERFWTAKRWSDFSRHGVYYAFAHATAAQRAEAFLRAFGDWEEGE